LKFRQAILQMLVSPVLRRNNKFKDIHKGETCYIIGNGASLKSMDLGCFSDKLTIGLNFLCIHNQFDKLNCPYFVIPAPKFLYPFYENPYTGKIQFNSTIQAFRKSIKKYPDISLFTSISNIFGYGAKSHNYYIHHFGVHEPSADYFDMSAIFSFMKGGLYSGLGIAMYMGFHKVILIGCDYLFSPMQDRHFYSKGDAVRSTNHKNIYESLLKESQQNLDILLITDTSRSSFLSYQHYQDFTGKELEYQENIDIVDDKYLHYFDKAFKKGLYQSPIY
jgi:hypothetical protein